MYIDNSSQYDIFSKIPNSQLWNNKDGYEIPYNQRGYIWNGENIITFLKDLDDARIGEKKFITLGTFYFLKESINASTSRITIWDGQQRVITLYILLSSILKFAKDVKNKMSEKKEDEDESKREEMKNVIENIIGKLEDYLFKKQFQFTEKEKNEYKKDKLNIPKIRSVYPQDNTLIKLIFNDKIGNIKELYCLKNGKYVCGCEKTYVDELKMIMELK